MPTVLSSRVRGSVARVLPGSALQSLLGTDVGRSGARTAAVCMLVRAAVAGLSAVSLLMTSADGTGQLLLAPVLAHALLAVLALVAVPAALRTEEQRRGRWLGGGVAFDVTFYACYSAAFCAQPGAGSSYGLLVLLMGPLLWGWRGLPLTAVPVGLVATLWPQRDALGVTFQTWQTWVLVLLFAAPAAGLSTLVRRGGARVARAEGQFRAAFDHASSGMALLGGDHRVLLANPALHALLGAQDLTGQQLQAHAADPAPLELGLASLSATRTAARFELVLSRSDGLPRWVSVVASAMSSGGVPGQVVVQVEDITERRTLQQQLTYQATHDLLTGLPNRRVLYDRLTTAVARRRPAAVLFVDLDHFKLVNDSLGHAVGDRLLLAAADRLRAALHPDDLVCRLGGDEFVIVCERTSAARLPGAAELVVAALQPAFELEGAGTLSATGSVGVVVVGPEATADTLVRDADTAMYAAKQAGGNRSVLFTGRLREQVVRRQELESGLRDALAAGALALHYQPIVDVSGQVVAAEALLRWRRDGQAMDPGELIAVAEHSGLVVELGMWVLRRALQDSTRWPEHVRLHVNVSPRQLDEAFPDRVRALLEEFRSPPGRLCLEVTETALSDDLDVLVARLGELRQLGVRLAIDDFGVGHASLTYLARLPVQEIKVDRSFVEGLPADGGSAAIIAGVLAMASAHGMEVVAEGVETAEQDAAVLRLGCTLRQGYLHHRPLTTVDLNGLWAVDRRGPVLDRRVRRPWLSSVPTARRAADEVVLDELG